MRLLIRFIFTKWKPKLISFVLALSLWGYHNTSLVSTVNVNVPVQYQNKPDHLHYKKTPPRFISVKVRGRKENLKFPTNNLKAVVNLIRAEEGVSDYRLKFDRRLLPESVEIASLPEKVSVSLQKMITAELPVAVNLTGELPEDFRRGRVSINPEKIRVRGPESEISELKRVRTGAISLNGVEKSFSRRIRIQKPTAGTEEINPRNVTVSVVVIAKNTTDLKVFEKVPVRVANLDPALKALLSDKTVEVQVQGEPAALRKLNVRNIQARVNTDGTRYNPKTGHILPYEMESGVPVRVRLLKNSDELEVVAVIPENLTIRFSPKKEFTEEEKNNEEQPNNDDNNTADEDSGEGG